MIKRGDIPNVEDCIKGRVYKLHCRNLKYGVWNGASGFIGIRTKFLSRFLATESHWDVCEHYGTVREAIDTGVDIPDSIMVLERFPSIDPRNDRLVGFDTPVDDGGKGWYYLDTGESDQSIKAISPANTKLFDFLNDEFR